ncbi:MAG TPA: PDZ domain-containing protein [Gemmataceae bacterium]|nr:PDZ domain-containing protein [Gemmataceae bacterium]
MSKGLITTAALVGLTLAGSFARADSQEQRAQRQLRNSFGLIVERSSRGGQDGVTISEVRPDSAAERAGLREGDVIVQVDQRRIEDFRDLVNAVQRTQRGERVSIQVERNNRLRTVRISPRMPGSDEYGELRSDRDNDEAGGGTTLQRLQQRFRRLEVRVREMERQGQYGQARSDSGDEEREIQRLQQRLEELEERVQQAERSGRNGRTSSSTLLGVQVREWRRQDDSSQGGSADEGVEVMRVDSDSLAAEAGLRRGDIITRVNDRDVATRQELRQAWQRIGSGQEANLEVIRGKRQMRIDARRESSSRYGRDRRYERLQERIERLEGRLREMEQNQ